VNIARDAEWDTSDNGLDGSFFGNELAGEAGEAIEVANALEHNYLDCGYTFDDLADELADVIICVDLLALKFGIFVDCSVTTFIGEFEVDATLIDLAIYTGRACNITKKLERERLGLVGSRATLDDLRKELQQILLSVFVLAVIYEVRLDVAVAKKFNKTSDKCDLQTKMAVPA
jgi:NTP pyrophosphatase (non-canonical NTP hydrolase)